MGLILKYQWLLLPVVVLACKQQPPEDSRERLAIALSDSMGRVSDAHVAFLRDSTHLLIELSGPEFYGMPDSMFPTVANDIARFGLRHYDKADRLDSVSVLDRDSVVGGWRVIHLARFSVEDLRNIR